MMKLIDFPAHSPYPRQLRLWQPEGEVRAIVLLSHGMAEHIDRYDRLAQRLNKEGYLVAGYNHLGHGDEAPLKGYFGEKDGWGLVVGNLHAVMAWLLQQNPGKKRVLLGHSMGSFLAREYALRYPKDLDILVLSGTGWHPASLCRFGQGLAGLICAMGGARKRSPLLDRISFSKNNKPFRAKDGTPYDWLSRDRKEVQSYLDDPNCGFVFCGLGFKDLSGGLLALSNLDRLKALNPLMPVYILSGKADPVGAMGAGVTTIKQQYDSAGLTDVTMALYEDARHEVFNEINRDEITLALIAWLNARTAL